MSSPWPTKGSFRCSSWYLMFSTGVVMLLMFTVEDSFFPTKCSACGSSPSDPWQVWSNHVTTRPLVQHNNKDVQQLAGLEHVGHDGSETGDNILVREDVSEATELRNSVDQDSQIVDRDLSEAPTRVERLPAEAQWTNADLQVAKRDSEIESFKTGGKVDFSQEGRIPAEVQQESYAQPLGKIQGSGSEVELKERSSDNSESVSNAGDGEDNSGSGSSRGVGDAESSEQEANLELLKGINNSPTTRGDDESGSGVDKTEGKPDKSLELPSSGQTSQNQTNGSPPPPSSIWYYTKIYKHPVAKLRLLTAKDGAPPIGSDRSAPEREITIVTQTSADRLQAVEATCMTWSGAMSVAVHVRLQSEFGDVHELLKKMHDRVEKEGRCRLNTQLATEDGFKTEEEALKALYPVNALRNVALGMATTKLVFLLDADFKPSPGLHESLTKDEGRYKELLKEATKDQKLFVVPAFEDANSKSLRGVVPERMEDLRERWKNGSVLCFHCVQSPTGHMPTNFKKFFDPQTTSPYSIVYRDGFEPYVIGAADSIPKYDARFRGYGENKVSQLYAAAAAGMGFKVLPNAFVFELPHPPSKAHETYVGRHRNPDQRYRIVGLYRQFKHEIAQVQSKKDPLRYKQFLEQLKG